MVNKKIWLGMLVMVLVLLTGFTACTRQGQPAQDQQKKQSEETVLTGSSNQGHNFFSMDGGYFGANVNGQHVAVIFTDTTFETKGWGDNGEEKGTYTVNGNNADMEATHYFYDGNWHSAKEAGYEDDYSQAVRISDSQINWKGVTYTRAL
jgi:hypothetical protein